MTTNRNHILDDDNDDIVDEDKR